MAGFALATVVFSMIFKRMPRVKLRWTDVLLPARLALLLLTVGHLLIGPLIGTSGQMLMRYRKTGGELQAEALAPCAFPRLQAGVSACL